MNIKNGTTIEADEFVGGGDDNILGNSRYTAILGGRDNICNDNHYSLLSGLGNEFSTEGQSNVLIGGRDNIMGVYVPGFDAPVSNSSIIGGRDNIMNDNVFNSSILSGRDNKILKYGRDSAIIGGSGNVINGIGARSVVLGGQNITGSTADTVYVPNLNINTIGSGVTIGNLGVDANNNVVNGQKGVDVFTCFKEPDVIPIHSSTAKGIPEGSVISSYTSIYNNHVDISSTLTTAFGTFNNGTGLFTTTVDCLLHAQVSIHLKQDTLSTVVWETGSTVTQIGLGICPNNATDIHVGDFLSVLPSVSRGLDISTGMSFRVLSGSTFRVKVLNQTTNAYPGSGTVSGDGIRFTITRLD